MGRGYEIMPEINSIMILNNTFIIVTSTGCAFECGDGKVLYFSPGHELHPYFMTKHDVQPVE